MAAPAAGLASHSVKQLMAEGQAKPIHVTALITAYYPVSHADVIVSKILEGYQRNDDKPGSNLKLVSMYIDQIHKDDLSQALAKKHSVRLCRTIDEAITLGTDRIQVAGVLSIAEHGDYALTPDTQQKMYPRLRFFDETVATFRRCGQVVPYFNDKHLSYRWTDAQHGPEGKGDEISAAGGIVFAADVAISRTGVAARLRDRVGADDWLWPIGRLWFSCAGGSSVHDRATARW
jgi:hypothetical protein